MKGEKVVEKNLNKSIKLIIYEDIINNVDKYGKETTTTYSNGSSRSSTSFKTTIYYGKDRFLQVDSDVPVKEGWTIKILYLKLDNSEEKFLCYKIIETNQYVECDSVDEVIAREYKLHAHTLPLVLSTAFLLLVVYCLFHTGHWVWGIISAWGAITMVVLTISFMTDDFKCPSEYKDTISYIYKAMHQLRDKGKQLTK